MAADSSGNRYVVVVALTGSFAAGSKSLTATTQSILVFRYPSTSYSSPTWAVNLMVRSLCFAVPVCVCWPAVGAEAAAHHETSSGMPRFEVRLMPTIVGHC